MFSVSTVKEKSNKTKSKINQLSLLTISIGNDEEFKTFLNRVYSKIQVNVQKKVSVKLTLYDELSKIMAKVAFNDPCYNFRVQFKGSSYEGLKIGEPDEFDYGLVNDNWAGKFSILVDANTPVGFGYAVQNIATCLDKFKVPGTKRIDASKVRGHLRDLVEEAMLQLGMKGRFVKRPWEGGPAVTFEFVSGDPEFLYISIDLAIGIDLRQWPPGARPRPAGVESAKAQLVPKVKLNANTEFWQISFAQVEKAIMENIDNDGGCRKKVLQLAKFFKGKSVGRWHPLASYHLKTILLHMNDEMKRPEDWKPSMLVPRFKDLINRLLKRLRTRILYSFFVPTQNLFDGKQAELPGAIVSVNDFLKTLRGNPQALLR